MRGTRTAALSCRLRDADRRSGPLSKSGWESLTATARPRPYRSPTGCSTAGVGHARLPGGLRTGRGTGQIMIRSGRTSCSLCSHRARPRRSGPDTAVQFVLDFPYLRLGMRVRSRTSGHAPRQGAELLLGGSRAGFCSLAAAWGDHDVLTVSRRPSGGALLDRLLRSFSGRANAGSPRLLSLRHRSPSEVRGGRERTLQLIPTAIRSPSGSSRKAAIGGRSYARDL